MQETFLGDLIIVESNSDSYKGNVYYTTLNKSETFIIVCNLGRKEYLDKPERAFLNAVTLAKSIDLKELGTKSFQRITGFSMELIKSTARDLLFENIVKVAKENNIHLSENELKTFSLEKIEEVFTTDRKTVNKKIDLLSAYMKL